MSENDSGKSLAYSLEEVVKSHLLPGFALLVVIVHPFVQASSEAESAFLKSAGGFFVAVIGLLLCILLGNIIDIARHTLFLCRIPHDFLTWIAKQINKRRTAKETKRRFAYYDNHSPGQVDTPRAVWQLHSEASPDELTKLLQSEPFRRCESLYYFGELFGNLLLVLVFAFLLTLLRAVFPRFSPSFAYLSASPTELLIMLVTSCPAGLILLLGYIDTMDDYLSCLYELDILS